jgi:stage III sporulation protein AG
VDKVNLSNDIKKIMNNKNFFNVLVFLLVAVFLWLATSSFGNDGLKNSSNKDLIPSGAEEVASSGEVKSKEVLEYEEAQKEELKQMLSKMEGVGSVEVMMYFESGEVKVPAVNDTTQVSETKEDDGEGGTRTNSQQTNGSTVVMSSNNNNNEPFILKTYKPQITGIFIVAEGATNSKVRYDVQVAVASLYNLSLDKVKVYPMGS